MQLRSQLGAASACLRFVINLTVVWHLKVITTELLKVPLPHFNLYNSKVLERKTSMGVVVVFM